MGSAALTQNLPGTQDCYLGQSPSFCPPPGLQVMGAQGPQLPPHSVWHTLQAVTKPLFCWGKGTSPSTQEPASLQPGTMGSHGVHRVSYCGIKCHKVRTKREPRALMGLLLPAGQRIQPIV